MRDKHPLLTIAIPTYNRSSYLAHLLGILAPQLTDTPNVELIISDNASPDDTSAVIKNFQKTGLQVTYIRNETNIGPDANFLQCFEKSNGKYVWIFGDDDVIVPGAIDKILRLICGHEYDLIYVRPYGFNTDFQEERRRDRFGRTAMVITDARLFAAMVGVMFTFMSAVIVNKARLMESVHQPISQLLGTNLIQFGWILPLLVSYKCGLVVFDGLVGGRIANSGGYDICKVFGHNLRQIVLNLLSSRPDLATLIINNTLRVWFPETLLQLRQNIAGNFATNDFHRMLMPLYWKNYRYWLFVFPIIQAPLWLAEACFYLQGKLLLRTEVAFQAIYQLLFMRKNYIY
jgi:abequosyltransferase